MVNQGGANNHSALGLNVDHSQRIRTEACPVHAITDAYLPMALTS